MIPLAPYYETTSFARLAVPTLVMGCQGDVVAPVAARAIPMYESIPVGISKAYLELAGGDHLCVETGNGNKAIQGKYAVAWMKALRGRGRALLTLPVRRASRRGPRPRRRRVRLPGELPVLSPSHARGARRRATRSRRRRWPLRMPGSGRR